MGAIGCPLPQEQALMYLQSSLLRKLNLVPTGKRNVPVTVAGQYKVNWELKGHKLLTNSTIITLIGFLNFLAELWFQNS